MEKWLTVVETPIFIKIIEEIITKEIKEDLIEYIAKNPTAGDLLTGAGGCRKIRWKITENTGKSGGIRTIYYYYNDTMPVYLLLAYPKSVKANISKETKNKLKQMVTELLKLHRSIKK
ncbi:type II toxin-antitoxin system RelE/ParE family toxin [Thiotrichales bacterium 19S9-12]|nr:type II toxin-antitoxin system RelE/ParE family toxin [Thiotrichales bacterium 19S9-11]MCF6811796.1 type II toxin-antitoxin system RelE/ParE family toxin [Thiotrichales bacterium 19S9-12]